MAKKNKVEVDKVLRKVTKALNTTKKELLSLLPSEKKLLAALDKQMKDQDGFKKMLDDAQIPDPMRTLLLKMMGNKELSKDLKALFRESLKFQLAEARKFLEF